MATATEHAPVTPAVLTWARERAGYSVEDVAHRLRIKPERVAKWEAGEARLTFRRVDALARLFHRPTAIFYMPQPPDERLPPTKDFRAGGAGEPDTPGLRYQLRLADERRRIAVDLAEGLDEDVRRFDFRTATTENTDDAGTRLRRLLGLPPPTDSSWSRPPPAYNRWREAAEARGILVFQAPYSELEGVRGFSIYERSLSVVVVRRPRRRRVL
jgi:transcriptional regulator with XRE-family HTH domain